MKKYILIVSIACAALFLFACNSTATNFYDDNTQSFTERDIENNRTSKTSDIAFQTPDKFDAHVSTVSSATTEQIDSSNQSGDTVEPWSYQCINNYEWTNQEIYEWVQTFSGIPGFGADVVYNESTENYEIANGANEVIDYILVANDGIKIFFRENLTFGEPNAASTGLDLLRVNGYTTEPAAENGEPCEIARFEKTLYNYHEMESYCTTEGNRMVIVCEFIDLSFRKGEMSDLSFEWGKVD